LRPAPTASSSPASPRAAQAPAGPGWVHEIKHGGYRLIVRRDGDIVRLRRGYDWTDRYPAITCAAATLRAKSFTIDGEAAVCGPDGVAVFDALHSRHKATDALLFGFDLLEREDLRPRPLGERKARLAKLLARKAIAIGSTSTPMRTVPSCSGTPARWAWRASCRSD
jgi:ATP-dependent DNA ligase